MNGDTQPRFAGIQALRALAAVLVVLLHLSGAEAKYGTGSRIIPKMFDYGGAGVDLFFVISGFVILSLCRRDVGSPAAAAPFLFRRFVRIYPVYWFYYGITLCALLIVPSWLRSYSVGDLVAAFALWPQSGVPPLPVSWTLSYEVFFYLVMAVAIMIVREGHLPRFLLVWAAINITGNLLLGDRALPPWCEVVIHPLSLEFIAGGFVGLLWNRVASQAGRAMAIFGLAGLFTAFAVLGSLEVAPPQGWGRVFAFGVPSVLLVLGAVVWEQGGTLRIPRWIAFVGDASYTLYLSHYFVLVAIGRFWSTFLPIDSVLVHAVVIVGALLAVALVASLGYVYLERPVLRSMKSSRASRSPMRVART